MEQINFRLNPEEKEILKDIAKIHGVSIAEFVKREILKNIAKERVDLAFTLLKEGKIGRKKTWMMSGLSGKEFLTEWSKRGAEEIIPDEVLKKSKELAKIL